MGTPRIDKLDRNLIINGNFDYAQRGQGVGTNATLSYIGPDRFLSSRVGSWFVSPVVQRLDGDSPSELSRYVYRTYNSEAGDVNAYEELEQRIESVFAREAALKPVSFSVKYKFQSYQNIKIEIFSADSVDNFSTSTLIYTETQSVTNDFLWHEFKSENVQLTAAASNGISVRLTFSNPSIVGSGNAYESRIGEMKLSIGTSVQDFSYAGRDVAEELQLCQRYYFSMNKSVDTIGSPYNNLSTKIYAHHIVRKFPVTMRVTPNISYSLRVGGSNTYVTSSYSNFGTSADYFHIRNGNSSYTATGDLVLNMQSDAEL